MKTFVLALLPILLEHAVAEPGTIQVFPSHKLLKSGRIVPISMKKKDGGDSGHDDDDNEDNQDLEEHDGYMFGLNIQMGNPPVSGAFLLSDILPNIYVPSINCTNCELAGITPFYNPNNSSTFVMGTNVTFGDNGSGSGDDNNDDDHNDDDHNDDDYELWKQFWMQKEVGDSDHGGSSNGNWNYGKGEITSGFKGNGTTGFDDICMIGQDNAGQTSSALCVPGSEFYMVNSFRNYHDSKYYAPFETFAGIFGMASNANSTSFLQMAVAAGVLNSTAWSYEPGNNGSGSMLLGGWNETQIKSDLAWLNNGNSTVTWNYTLAELSIDNDVIFASPENSTVTFSTSYKGVGVPKTVFDDICSTLQDMNSNVTEPITCSNSTTTELGTITGGAACTSYDSNFNVTMKFDSNATFVMYGQTYMHNETNTGGQVVGCLWGFVDSNTTGNDFFIGENFVTQFYTIFDSDNNNMGFGLSVNNANANTGPWLLFSGDSPAPAGLSSLAIVGITAGSIAVAAIAGFVIFKVIQNRRAKSNAPNAAYSDYLETT